MNKFTKHELEELRRCCNWVINCKDTHYTSITYVLPEKLQSMIDNYCEHYWNNVCCGCQICSTTCTKCNRSLDNDRL